MIQKLAENRQKRKIGQKYFMCQQIYHPMEADDFSEEMPCSRFFLVLIHKANVFHAGIFREQRWERDEFDRLLVVLDETEEGIRHITEITLTEDNLLVLYGIENISSLYKVKRKMEQTGRKIGQCLSEIESCQLILVCSGEVRKEEISPAFQKLSGQIRYCRVGNPADVRLAVEHTSGHDDIR